MLADIMILCINPKDDDFELENERFAMKVVNHNPASEHKCYWWDWFVINSMNAYWYELFSKKVYETEFPNECEDFIQLGDISDDIDAEMILLKHKRSRNIKVKFNPDYIEAFSQAIDEIKKNSKCKKVGILFRIQENEKERFIGGIPKKRFLDMLENDKVYFNVAYFLK